MTDLPEPARYGEVIHTRPSPEEFEEAGHRVAIIRRNIAVLRDEVSNLQKAWSPTEAHDRSYRDVEGLLTAALVMLYESETRFPKWAAIKREKLAHPETYVIREGFADERDEKGLVEVWWWDKYHTDFGPNLTPMPWREPPEAGPCKDCGHNDREHSRHGSRSCMVDEHDPDIHDPETLVLCHCSAYLPPAAVGV